MQLPLTGGCQCGAVRYAIEAEPRTLYACHCFDDSPLFVMTWYVTAAIPVIVVGAMAGHWLLRW